MCYISCKTFWQHAKQCECSWQSLISDIVTVRKTILLVAILLPMDNALPNTGLKLPSRNSFLDLTEHLKTRCSYHIVGRGVESPWWSINWVAWQRDHPKWTLGQRNRWALVHLEESESAESAERTMSGHDENVEALSYRPCDCGERQTMSHLMTCVHAPNCTWTDLANPRRRQLCQTLGGIYLTVNIEVLITWTN